MFVLFLDKKKIYLEGKGELCLKSTYSLSLLIHWSDIWFWLFCQISVAQDKPDSLYLSMLFYMTDVGTAPTLLCLFNNANRCKETDVIVF